MIKTNFFVLGLIFVLSGCATTGSQHTQTQLLERQVSDLDLRLKENDRQISRLKGELKGARYDVNRDNRKMVVEEFVPLTKSSSGEMTGKQIQQALKNAGYYNGTVDGKVGSKTTEAIKKFQKANGLKTDGVAGSSTQSKLKKHLNKRR